MRYETIIHTPSYAISNWKEIRKIGYEVKSFLEARGCSYVVFVLRNDLSLKLSFNAPKSVDLGILYEQLGIIFFNCEFEPFVLEVE